MLLSYTVRNLIARKASSLQTLIAVAGTVGATTAMLALLEGLAASVMNTGHATNAVVLSKGARAEGDSDIKFEELVRIKSSPGVARIDGVDQISPEYVNWMTIKRSDGKLEEIKVRGVDPIAFVVHAGVHVDGGAPPPRGEMGLIVGQRRLGQFDGFVPGEGIWFGGHRWPVVAVLRAPGTMFESEIWCDRAALMSAKRSDSLSAVTVTLEDAQKQGPFADSVAKLTAHTLTAISEPDYYQRKLESVTLYVHVIEVVVLLLAIASIFACSNALYAAFLGRIKELATLRIIGFSRGRIILLVVQESVILAAAGGAIGLCCAAAIHGRSLTYRELSLFYTARVTLRVLLAGASVAVAVGIIGSIASVIQAMRISVLESVRE